jgi:hypothetical protein
MTEALQTWLVHEIAARVQQQDGLQDELRATRDPMWAQVLERRLQYGVGYLAALRDVAQRLAGPRPTGAA